MAASLFRSFAKLPRVGLSLKPDCHLAPSKHNSVSITSITNLNYWTRNLPSVNYHSIQRNFNKDNNCNFNVNRLRAQLCPSRSFIEDRKTTALTVFSDLKHLKSSPLPALTLGLSGLIPFVAAPCYIIYSGAYLTDVAFMQAVYGATILSFLGGVRWGVTVPEESRVQPDWLNLGYSVIPPLVAWVGLLMPPVPCTLTLIAGLAGTAYFDVMSWCYPPWFKALRFILSLVAILSLWTTLTCKLIYLEKTEEGSEKKEE